MFLKHYGEILERNREAANTKWKLTLSKKKKNAQWINYKEEMAMLLDERIKGEFCQLYRSRKGKWEIAEEDHIDKITMSIEETTAKFLGGPGTWKDLGESNNQKSEEEAESPDAAQRIMIWIQPSQLSAERKNKNKNSVHLKRQS